MPVIILQDKINLGLALRWIITLDSEKVLADCKHFNTHIQNL